MKHTPGPWTLDITGGDSPYNFWLDAPKAQEWICRDGEISSKANARLIAAAPDLLQAAQIAIDILEDAASDDGLKLILEHCSKAVAKAEGTP